MSSSEWAGWTLMSLALLSSSPGCQALNLRSQSPEPMGSNNEFETNVVTPLIGDYITVAGLNLVTLEGVGLVTGLEATGGDPPPSVYRTALLEEMKKRNARNPNLIMQSPNTALVLVRAYLPPLVRKLDRFDIEVRLPGNSNATSLSGGKLLEAYLSEQAIVPGRGILKGHLFAKAKGPILISTAEGDDDALAGVVRRGRIVQGGVSLKNRDLTMYLRNDFRSVRNSRRIASRIGLRFHSYNKYGMKEPLAEAKTDQTMLLKVHPRYKDNYPRYLRVIRNISFRETPVARRVRMQKLKRELNTPETCEIAALQFEGIGNEAVPILKTGLQSQHLECRFHAAVALAYLEDASGVPVLSEAAVSERAFRVFALAALAALDEPEANVTLRELMSVQFDKSGQPYDSAELRYGAFRAMQTLDSSDPFIGGEELHGQFKLHVLETEGSPLIHLAHHRHSEIVLFGAEQRFRTPIFVKAGNRIHVSAPPGSDQITVSRYALGEQDQRQVTSTRIADVIRAVADSGGTYPDVAQMLMQAKKQHNAPGRIEIDSLPQAGRTFFRPGTENTDLAERAVRVGQSALLPNMFPSKKIASQFRRRESFKPSQRTSKQNGTGIATLADARKSGDKAAEGNGFLKFFPFGRKSESQEPSTGTDSPNEESMWQGLLKRPWRSLDEPLSEPPMQPQEAE